MKTHTKIGIKYLKFLTVFVFRETSTFVRRSMLKNLNVGAANVETKFGKQKSKKIKMKKVIFFNLMIFPV
jgi:hypothetical protein